MRHAWSRSHQRTTQASSPSYKNGIWGMGWHTESTLKALCWNRGGLRLKEENPNSVITTYCMQHLSFQWSNRFILFSSFKSVEICFLTYINHYCYIYMTLLLLLFGFRVSCLIWDNGQIVGRYLSVLQDQRNEIITKGVKDNTNIQQSD